MNATPNLGGTPNQLVFPPVVTTAANTSPTTTGWI